MRGNYCRKDVKFKNGKFINVIFTSQVDNFSTNNLLNSAKSLLLEGCKLSILLPDIPEKKNKIKMLNNAHNKVEPKGEGSQGCQ